MDRRRKHHQCGTAGNWPICVACEGRIHFTDCMSPKDRRKDCCPARHKMLYEAGHTHGIQDAGVLMWKPEN